MMSWGYGDNVGAWLAMCVVMLVNGVIVAVGVVALLRRPRPWDEGDALPNDAQRILDERLALGEIGDEEYLQREAMLRSSP